MVTCRRYLKTTEYPGDFNYDEIASGKEKVLKPDKEPEWGPNWDEDVGEGEYPNSYYFYLPVYAITAQSLSVLLPVQ